MARVDKLIEALKELSVSEGFELPIQTFNTPGTDFKKMIYNEDGIRVFFAPGYYYIDVLGLNDDEYEQLFKKGVSYK